MSFTKPASVRLEKLPDGKRRVILTRNVSKGTTTDEEVTQTIYTYEEAVFYLPADRQETIKSITENFDAWWACAGEEVVAPTLEERVAANEEALAALLDMMLGGGEA